MTRRIEVGTSVRVLATPDLSSMPEGTKTAFQWAVGRTFQVAGFGRYGHLQLELGPELDALIGGYMNDIWIEPELVEVVE